MHILICFIHDTAIVFFTPPLSLPVYFCYYCLYTSLHESYVLFFLQAPFLYLFLYYFVTTLQSKYLYNYDGTNFYQVAKNVSLVFFLFLCLMNWTWISVSLVNCSVYCSCVKSAYEHLLWYQRVEGISDFPLLKLYCDQNDIKLLSSRSLY